MSSVFRHKLVGRIVAFGVSSRHLVSDAALLEAGRLMFGVAGETVDDVWHATEGMTKAARSSNGRKARGRKAMAKYFAPPRHDEILDPEKEEREAIRKALYSGWHRPPTDRSPPLDQFLRRSHWARQAEGKSR